MVTVHWRGNETFVAETPDGHSLVMEPPSESSTGPSPVEAFVAAAAACSAIDVISILHKMRQPVESYRVEVEWERGEPDVFPRPITSVVLRHIVSGEGVNPEAVEKAVRLSDEKYCGILATLRQPPAIETRFVVEAS